MDSRALRVAHFLCLHLLAHTSQCRRSILVRLIPMLIFACIVVCLISCHLQDSLSRRLWFSDSDDAAYLCDLVKLRGPLCDSISDTGTGPNSNSAGQTGGNVREPLCKSADAEAYEQIIVLKSTAAAATPAASATPAVKSSTPLSAVAASGMRSNGGKCASSSAQDGLAVSPYDELSAALELRYSLMVGTHTDSHLLQAGRSILGQTARTKNIDSDSGEAGAVIGTTSTLRAVDNAPDDWLTCDEYVTSSTANAVANANADDASTKTILHSTDNNSTATAIGEAEAAAAAASIGDINSSLSMSVSTLIEFVCSATADDWFPLVSH